MKLHASGEDYLRTILLLQRQQGYVRAISNSDLYSTVLKKTLFSPLQ